MAILSQQARMYRLYLIAFLFGVSLSPAANAWFFIFPIPNLAKPAPLNALIEALEKSEETKSVAYVSEDKVFGTKYWVWGHFSGHVTQADADRIALSRCQESLSNAKSRTAGEVKLYDFGTKVCELYDFVNKTVSRRATEQQRATPAPTAIDTTNPTPLPNSPPFTPGPPGPEWKPSVPDDNQWKAPTPTTPTRLEEAKQNTSKEKVNELAGVQPPTIDFNAEARKSARILGCTASELKVTGVEQMNVVYFVTCNGGASLSLSCDPTGLCLKK